jgi:hypothetical protein
VPTLKQYEELAVLEQGDDGAIVSIRGQGGPSALLGAQYMEHLSVISARARKQLEAIPQRFEVSAIKLLCSEVGTLVATYTEARNKYEGGPSPSAALAVALEELEELRRNLEATFGAGGNPTSSPGSGQSHSDA